MKHIIDNLKTVIGHLKCEFISDTAVEIHASGSVYVTGCKKITSYTTSKIVMKCSEVTISFEGNGLKLENLINGQICVKGRLFGVNFNYD